MPNPKTKHIEKKGEESYFSSYEAHSKTLRGWLIIYGAALPTFFLKEETFASLLRDSGHGQLIIGLFLIGILSQVVQVFLYKIAMGYIYLGEEDGAFKNSWRYKVSSWFSFQTWPVIISDLGTIFLYGWASWLLMTAFLTPKTEVTQQSKPEVVDVLHVLSTNPTPSDIKKEAEQGGVDKPDAAPELKPSDDSTPNPESKPRSQ